MLSTTSSNVSGRVAPDGSYVAVVYASSVAGVMLDGQTLWEFPTNGPARPAISPDGKKVAATDNTQLLVYDIPTGQLNKWTVTGDRPDWSPDMSRLAYDHDGHVYIFDLAKGASVPLAEGSDPSWAPGGRAVAVRSGRHTFDLITVDARVRTRLFEGDNTWTPRWSPDGEWMSYGASGGYRWWSLSERLVEPRQVIVRHVKTGAEAVVGITLLGNNRDFTWAKSPALCRGVS